MTCTCAKGVETTSILHGDHWALADRVESVVLIINERRWYAWLRSVACQSQERRQLDIPLLSELVGHLTAGKGFAWRGRRVGHVEGLLLLRLELGKLHKLLIGEHRRRGRLLPRRCGLAGARALCGYYGLGATDQLLVGARLGLLLRRAARATRGRYGLQ